MLKIGLTGGIGSGKSVVAARLASLGAVVVDSDRIAREVVAPGTDGLREVVSAFGPRVCRDDGSLDRAAVGEIVFADPDARGRLEAIIHPRVRERSAQLVAEAPPDAIVVNDVPLLVEVGLAPTYHLVVVVRAAEATRIGRLVRDRGMSPEQAEQRIRAQAGDDRRDAAADVLLDNDGEIAGLHRSVDRLWHDRLLPYERNVRARRPAWIGGLRPVESDPSWPTQFARLAARIRHAVRPAEVRVDQIGPTAVPGLPAEDVIDVQVGVGALSDADALADRLAEAGFPRCPQEWPDRARAWSERVGAGERGETRAWPDRASAGESRLPDEQPDRGPAGAGTEPREHRMQRLHGGADPGRAVNLYVRVTGTPGWRAALLVRDHLRAVPERRAGYPAVGRRLATPGPEASARADDQWFDLEYRRAEEWAAERGWRP